MHNSDDPLFNKYDQDGYMPEDEEDEGDSCNTRQAQGQQGFKPQDERRVNEFRD